MSTIQHLRSSAISPTILKCAGLAGAVPRLVGNIWTRQGVSMADKLVTDIGGDPAGPIPMEDHEQLFWEKQMIAAFNLLQVKNIVATDEFRRTVEEMSPEEYKNSTFYGRRLDGMVRLLIKKGVIDEGALEQRTRAIWDAGTRDHV